MAVSYYMYRIEKFKSYSYFVGVGENVRDIQREYVRRTSDNMRGFDAIGKRDSFNNLFTLYSVARRDHEPLTFDEACGKSLIQFLDLAENAGTLYWSGIKSLQCSRIRMIYGEGNTKNLHKTIKDKYSDAVWISDGKAATKDLHQLILTNKGRLITLGMAVPIGPALRSIFDVEVISESKNRHLIEMPDGSVGANCSRCHQYRPWVEPNPSEDYVCYECKSFS